MVEHHDRGLQIVGLVRAKRRVKVGPAEELRLVAVEKIRLGAVARKLDPPVVTLVVMISIRHGANGGRERHPGVGAQRAAGHRGPADNALVDAALTGAILPRLRGHIPLRADGPPVVGNGAGIRIEPAQGVLRPGQDARRRDHGRRHGELREIMPRLRIEKEGAADSKSGVLKDAPLDRDIRLTFGLTPRFHVQQRLIAQRRDRHGKRCDGVRHRHPGRIHRKQRQLHRFLRLGAGDDRRGGRDQHAKAPSHRQKRTPAMPDAQVRAITGSPEIRSRAPRPAETRTKRNEPPAPGSRSRR